MARKATAKRPNVPHPAKQGSSGKAYTQPVKTSGTPGTKAPAKTKMLTRPTKAPGSGIGGSGTKCH